MKGRGVPHTTRRLHEVLPQHHQIGGGIGNPSRTITTRSGARLYARFLNFSTSTTARQASYLRSMYPLLLVEKSKKRPSTAFTSGRVQGPSSLPLRLLKENLFTHPTSRRCSKSRVESSTPFRSLLSDPRNENMSFTPRCQFPPCSASDCQRQTVIDT